MRYTKYLYEKCTQDSMSPIRSTWPSMYVLATTLSAGDSTYRIGLKGVETGISQVFLCIYPGIFNDNELQQKLMNEIIDYVHDVEPMHPGEKTYYPGEKSSLTRARNLEEGIPVNESIWERVLSLSN